MSSKKNFYSIITVTLFAMFSIFWIYTHIMYEPASITWEMFAATYGLMALWGGIVGLIVSRSWGGFSSVLGRAMIMFSIGLLLQEFGQLTYSYYIYFQHIDVPYPSVGDIGFFGSIPAYIYGIFLLGRAAGTHVSLRSYWGQAKAVLIPLVLLIISYMSFLVDYDLTEVPVLTLLLDFGYPLGQAIYVSLAVLVFILSRSLLGGIMRMPLFLMLGALVMQYLSDYMFLYQNLKGTWVVGGMNDYLYLFSYTLMTLGLISVYSSLKKLRSHHSATA